MTGSLDNFRVLEKFSLS